jgi:hypothetical protein
MIHLASPNCQVLSKRSRSVLRRAGVDSDGPDVVRFSHRALAATSTGESRGVDGWWAMYA